MPSLEISDAEATQLIYDGYLVYEGIIPERINAVARELPPAYSPELDRVVEDITAVPEVAAIFKAILGADYEVTGGRYVHLNTGTKHAIGWHSDERPGHEPEPCLERLWVLYYPHDVALADGPTMVLTGSHLRAAHGDAMSHYDNIVGQKAMTVPAGTLALCHPGIWHRTGGKISDISRYMIKFYAARRSSPQRDWAEGPAPPFERRGFRPAYTNEEDYWHYVNRAEMLWRWMCGLT